jgi:hypothetical protein
VVGHSGSGDGMTATQSSLGPGTNFEKFGVYLLTIYL